MMSFQRALELGAHALETDVHMTRDGRIVVSHDETGARAANDSALIRESNWEQVRSWDAGWQFVAEDGSRPFAKQGVQIPLLEEVLEAFPDVRLNVDVKQPDPVMVEPLIELIRDHEAEDRVTLASFSPNTMRRIRASGYGGRMGLGQREVLALLFAPGRMAGRWLHGDAAQIPTRAGPFNLTRPKFIERCHELGLIVEYWTINDPDEAKRLLALGADGIMTDDVSAVAPAFESA